MTQAASNWSRIPVELRERPQWAVAAASKAPQARGPDGKLFHVGVTSPSQWMTFEAACALAWELRDVVTTHTNSAGVTTTQVGYTIGYILNEADPFTCIDLDVKDAETHPDEPGKWTTNDDFTRYLAIINGMDSYTERSKSTKGIHTWVKGAIGKGFRRDGVEVYSQERFIISTGDVYINKPIEEREFLLNNMVSRMRPVEDPEELIELEPVADDWYILLTASLASNNEKFFKLWNGLWKDEMFPTHWTQSEADLALMSMFTFYSDSNAQVRRLFRDSKLGKREKATKDDKYINFTLKTIRGRQARERGVELRGILAAADRVQDLKNEEIQRMQGGVPPAQHLAGPLGPIAPREVQPLQVLGAGDPVVVPPPASAALAQLAPVSPQAVAAAETGLAWPPGYMGTLARYIYQSSYLPIKEVSIVAALGLMSGICGKAWHIPQSGLNLYIVLVARSAIGKEALHHSIASIVSACIPHCPQFGNFADFTEYASGPALIKACSQNDSFVNVSGEWGRRMKRIAMEDDREGPMSTLRTQMTNLYQKSAPKSIVGGIGYSSQENNVDMLRSVAYSMVGESTPQTFYDSLTESMMEDGFLSRFLVIQYEGDRPEENSNILESPDEELIKNLCSIAGRAYTNNGTLGSAASTPVERMEDAAVLLAAFGKEASDNIRSTNDEARRQMWNRATLKVLRVAALLAVVDNFTQPVVKVEHAQWAIDLIRSDIAIMKKRLEGGDVGLGDSSRERKLVALMDQYQRKAPSESYKIDPKMRENSIIPRNYMQVRTARASAFSKYKLGPNVALDHTLQMLVSNGYIMEVKGDKLSEAYNYQGKAYRILRLPNYEQMAQDKE